MTGTVLRAEVDTNSRRPPDSPVTQATEVSKWVHL
jgi:hypothetical protein